MPKIKHLSHVAVAVKDIDAALTFWHDALGLELDRIEEVPQQKSIVAFLPVGDSSIELVEPTSTDTGVARFLQKHGPGMHHICIEVEDLPGILERLISKGVRLIDETPVYLSNGRSIAFIHPQSTNGVLVELYENAN